MNESLLGLKTIVRKATADPFCGQKKNKVRSTSHQNRENKILPAAFFLSKNKKLCLFLDTMSDYDEEELINYSRLSLTNKKR